MDLRNPDDASSSPYHQGGAPGSRSSMSRPRPVGVPQSPMPSASSKDLRASSGSWSSVTFRRWIMAW